MGTEKMICCGALTRVYSDVVRRHNPGCKYAVSEATTIAGTSHYVDSITELQDELVKFYARHQVTPWTMSHGRCSHCGPIALEEITTRHGVMIEDLFRSKIKTVEETT